MRLMKKFISIFIFLGGILFASLSYASAPTVTLSNIYPYEGDATFVRILNSKSDPVNVSFGGLEFPVFSYSGSFASVLPVKAAEPSGWKPVKVNFSDGTSVTKWIYVVKKNFPVISMEVPGNTTSGELLQNIQSQTEDLGNILSTVTPEVFFSGRFGLPLIKNDKVATSFGEIMKIGTNEVRHLGVDLASSKGSAIGAMNGGVVRYADLNGTYGNMVVIDHGEGIYSMYLHLSKIIAKVGDTVKKGQLIGLVGNTGYSTGPHLHLSVKISGISVNPLSFVTLFK